MITSDKWNVDSILIGVPSNGIPSGRIEKDTKISRERDRQRDTEKDREKERQREWWNIRITWKHSIVTFSI